MVPVRSGLAIFRIRDEMTTSKASAHTMSMVTEDAAGRWTIAIWHRTLYWAVDELVEKLVPEQLRKLDVRAGEHLAAILTTAFLRTAPAAVDTTGGVDLSFDLPDIREPRSGDILPAGVASAAFEVKSLPGGFRKFDGSIDRAKARGVDPTGGSMEARVRDVKGVLRDARPWLLGARSQLHRKTGGATSMNAFLVIHPFDYMTVECSRDYVIGPYLDPLKDVGDLDTVWVLWHPHHLTMWSHERHEWINLLFDVTNPGEKPGELPVLQDAEQYFFKCTGYTGRSPYLYITSYDEGDPNPS